MRALVSEGLENLFVDVTKEMTPLTTEIKAVELWAQQFGDSLAFLYTLPLMKEKKLNVVKMEGSGDQTVPFSNSARGCTAAKEGEGELKDNEGSDISDTPVEESSSSAEKTLTMKSLNKLLSSISHLHSDFDEYR